MAKIATASGNWKPEAGSWKLVADLGALRMDYLIAGIATVLLFVYLVYALLRPERF